MKITTTICITLICFILITNTYSKSTNNLKSTLNTSENKSKLIDLKNTFINNQMNAPERECGSYHKLMIDDNSHVCIKPCFDDPNQNSQNKCVADGVAHSCVQLPNVKVKVCKLIEWNSCYLNEECLSGSCIDKAFDDIKQRGKCAPGDQGATKSLGDQKMHQQVPVRESITNSRNNYFTTKDTTKPDEVKKIKTDDMLPLEANQHNAMTIKPVDEEKQLRRDTHVKKVEEVKEEKKKN